MIDQALKYLSNGVNILPIGTQKRPIKDIITWSQYQKRLMTKQEVNQYFSSATLIATIGGAISGGREHIDIDCKYDLTGTLWEEYSQMIKNHDEDLFSKLVIVRTPSGGYHLIYRTNGTPSSNGKLANRPATEDEKEHDPHTKVKVLIEIKAEGGYCLAPPSAGYSFVSSIEIAPIITEEQRDLLLTLARSFNQVHDGKVYIPRKIKGYDDNIFVENPFEAYNKNGDCVKELIAHGWSIVGEKGSRIHLKRPGDSEAKTSGNYSTEHNKFFCFSSSTEFECEKAYSPVAVYCLLNCQNDWSICAKKLIENGFGRSRKKIDSKYVKKIYELKIDDKTNEEIIVSLKEIEGKSDSELKEILENYEANQGKNIKMFWTITPNKDIDKKPKISIHLTKFVRFIMDNLNIYRYKIAGAETIFRYVRITDNIIEEVKITDIKDGISEYIKSLEYVFDNIYRDDLMETIQRQANNLFSNAQMEFLDYTDVKILKSSKEVAYYPFKNCIAKISAENEIETIPFKELKGFVIWKSSIIQHSFSVDNDYLDFSFNKFFLKINSDNEKKINFAQSLVGYMLHDYKDAMRPYATIFGESSSSAKVGGGTGKGLLAKAIGKLVKTITIDGKGFKADKPFAFQRITLDCKIILLQDTDKGFNFESLFSKLTDGLTVERKNRDELFLDFDDSPKILITTNYNIDNESQAASRRQMLMEFSEFFSDKNTPANYLGEHLFLSWNKDQWNKFYTLMLNCVVIYLKNGITKLDESSTSKEKRISLRFTPAFYNWFAEKRMIEPKLLSELHNSFLEESEFNQKEYSRIRFNKAIQFACDVFKYKLEATKDTLTRKQMLLWNKQDSEQLPF